MTPSRRGEARAARAEIEDAIDARGGAWSLALSRLIDLWLLVEEGEPA